jgi:primary-amine oxidase
MVATRLRFAVGAGSLMGSVFLAFILVMGATEEAAAQSGSDTISFNAGTQWVLTWELRQREGLVIRMADYRDRGGVSRRVLVRGSIAEVHVPYHTGSPRFLDVTLSTTGLGANALNLAGTECNGVLVDPKICRETHDRGYAWKFDGIFQRGQEVTYWISSQLGQYNYITLWTFRDDGSFEPRVGFTGRLQIRKSNSAYAPFGSRLNPETATPPEFGINHMHNVYWRLDLDIDGSANDAVNRITQVQHLGASPEPGVNCGIVGTCYINQVTRLTSEIIERLQPFTTWHQIDRGTFNADGRPIGYEIIPKDNQSWTGPSTEPWAAGELYVTRFNSCELFAVNNNNPSVNPGCGSAAPHVQAMGNAEAIDGADIVLWYTAHFQHVTRDEDQVNMPIEYIWLELQPRSWRHVNTLE